MVFPNNLLVERGRSRHILLGPPTNLHSLLIFNEIGIVHQVNVISKVAADNRVAWAFDLFQAGNILVTTVADFYFLVGIPRHVVKVGGASRTKYVATLPAVVLPGHDTEG